MKKRELALIILSLFLLFWVWSMSLQVQSSQSLVEETLDTLSKYKELSSEYEKHISALEETVKLYEEWYGGK